MRRSLLSTLVLFLASALPASAAAFCGFYVSGADASLYSSATMVVMMREGTTTVLSMQNNYQGPPEDFAMVVPVPVVLEKENVKTLPREIFDRVDRLAAPRLVEYWELDPCYVPPPRIRLRKSMSRPRPSSMRQRSAAAHGVTIEAQFSVAEYDILILSARDSTGLDTWLRQEKYNIPKGAEKVLAPYVAQGTKFFVAKVDAERVTFEDGRAVLSPLRFHYDADELALPVRLGLLNSAGQQDLLVHILARGQRYEVANYPNATIPTNIVVENETRNAYGAFYDMVFRRTVAHNPGAVVTEYAWDAQSCDPCPVPALNTSELASLGADLLKAQSGSFVLTRLHYRYGPKGLGEDLVFRAAPPIVGGRGMPDSEGRMREESAQPAGYNNFQGRYIILHRWEKEVTCANPMPGRWGGPPGAPMPIFGAPSPLRAKSEPGDAAQAPTELASIGNLVKVDVAPIGLKAGHVEAPHPRDPGPAGVAPESTELEPSEDPGAAAEGTPGGNPPKPVAPKGGCASCTVAGESPAAPFAAFGFLAALLFLRRRRS